MSGIPLCDRSSEEKLIVELESYQETPEFLVGGSFGDACICNAFAYYRTLDLQEAKYVPRSFEGGRRGSTLLDITEFKEVLWLCGTSRGLCWHGSISILSRMG